MAVAQIQLKKSSGRSGSDNPFVKNGSNSTSNRFQLCPVTRAFAKEKQRKRLLRRFDSRRFAALLGDSDERVAQTVADRINACNRDENLFVGEDVKTENIDGDIIGTLWSCRSRFCRFCVGRLRRRSRRIAEYVFRRIGYKGLRYAVFTMPDNALAGLSLDMQHAVAYHAWRHLLKHSSLLNDTFDKKSGKISRAKIKGTIRADEFTIEEERLNPFHYHLNLLLDSPFLSARAVREEWTKALKLAFAHFDIAWHCPTKDGLVNLKIKRVVKNVRDKENEISATDVIFELVKYITKPQDWDKLPMSDVEAVLKNPVSWKMFSLTGTCKEIAKKFRRKSTVNQILKKAAALIGQSDSTVNDNNHAYFKSQRVTVRENPEDSDVTTNSPPKQRKKSWYRRITEDKITREQYLDELTDEFKRTIKFRKRQLREKYFIPSFFTLDGVSF